MLAEVMDMSNAETNERSDGDVISSMLIGAWGNSGCFFAPTIDFQQSGDYLLCYSLVAPKCASTEITGNVKTRRSKRRNYQTLSAPHPDIINYLEKHDMQFVSETLLFHVTVRETTEIDDHNKLKAPSVESIDSVAPTITPARRRLTPPPAAAGVLHMPKSNSLFVGQPPLLLKKLAHVHLIIHQFKSEIFGHVEIDFSLWDLFSAITAKGICPKMLMTLHLQLLVPLLTELKSRHKADSQQWTSPKDLPTEVTWPETVRQVRCKSGQPIQCVFVSDFILFPGAVSLLLFIILQSSFFSMCSHSTGDSAIDC